MSIHTAKITMDDALDMMERKNYPYYRIISPTGDIVAENNRINILEDSKTQFIQDCEILGKSLIYAKLQIPKYSIYPDTMSSGTIGSSFKYGLQYDIILNEAVHDESVKEYEKKQEAKKEPEQIINTIANTSNDMNAKDMIQLFSFFMNQSKASQEQTQAYTNNLLKLQKDFYTAQIRSLREDKEELADRLDEISEEINGLKEGKEERMLDIVETLGAGIMGTQEKKEEEQKTPVAGQQNPEARQALELVSILKKVDPKYIQNLHALCQLAVNEPDEYHGLFEEEEVDEEVTE